MIQSKIIKFRNKRYFTISFLMLVFNCTTTENATRLEKWSSMMQQESEIFGTSISEFGILKPMIERRKYGRNLKNPTDEYVSILYETEKFAEDICKNISDWNISSSKGWIDHVISYINTNNVNLETLERSLNYKNASESRIECNSISQKSQFILDDILSYVQKIKTDLDDSQKHNRQNRITSIQNRIRNPISDESEDEKSELFKKKEIIKRNYSEFAKVVNALTEREFLVTEYTWRFIYIVNVSLGGDLSNVFNWYAVNGIFSVAIGNSIFSSKLEDRRTVKSMQLEDNVRFFEERIAESDAILIVTQYVIINDKENKIPGFDEYAASFDFQITNYLELHQYLLLKNNIKFKSEDIKKICSQYNCDVEVDIVLLKKNAKATIDKLSQSKYIGK